MNSWIFQGNPNIFKVDQYVSERENIWWSIRQKHLSKYFALGDEVYLWRSDGGRRGTGGILARAIVVGAIVERIDEDAKDLWLTNDCALPGFAIPLKVLEVKLKEGFISRLSLEAHPILKGLRILHMRSETNYLLTEEQAHELHKLWGVGSEYPDEADEAISFPEGRQIYKLHRTIERNPNLIRQAKQKELEASGELRCKVCGFSFYEKYGVIGQDYIEGHHIVPISQIREQYEATIGDIILVCSNCHRMLHRKRPWISAGQLKELLK